MTGHTHNPQPALSVIIPTRNRAAMLRDTLHSLTGACADREDAVECLVIDNNSTDDTRSVVAASAADTPFPVRYIYEPCPGLHVGRNLGAVHAQGEILAYLDDDVFVQPGWAKAILDRFASDNSIVLAGGPCRPLWEQEPPAWIETFRTSVERGWHISVLSLIDLGSSPCAISGSFVFGCNFVIRKKVLFDLHGFHPDGMPDDLLCYRGDGESWVGQAVDAMPGAVTFYDPDIAVLHRIPAKRLTREYLYYVAARNGYGGAYALYRQYSSDNIVKLLRILLSTCLSLVKSWKLWFVKTDVPTLTGWYNAYRKTQICHLIRLCFSPKLARWALQDSYFAEDPCPYWPAKEPDND